MERIHAGRVRAVAVVLAVAATVAAIGPPARAAVAGSATPEFGPDLGMIAAMQRDLHLTADQARARIAREDAAGRIEHALRGKLGTAFGGAWLAGDDLVVGITDASRAGEVRAAGAKPTVVRHSLAQLDAVKAKLDASVRSAPSVLAFYIDVKANQVVVEAAPTALKAAGDYARAATSDPTAVRVEPSAGRPKDLADVHGGDWMYTTEFSDCSVGFTINQNYYPYAPGFLTAGHCVDPSSSPGSTVLGHGGILGTARGSRVSYRDHAWVQAAAGATTFPDVNLYDGGTTTVQGWNEAPVGASVCASGYTSHWRCGTIQSKNNTVTTDTGTVYDQVRTSLCSAVGDSGGPVLNGSQAQGTVTKGVGCTTYFEPVVYALSEYGLRLQTGGGSLTPPKILWMGCEFLGGVTFECSLSYYHPDGASVRWAVNGVAQPSYDDNLGLTSFCPIGSLLGVTVTVFNGSGSDTFSTSVYCDMQ